MGLTNAANVRPAARSNFLYHIAYNDLRLSTAGLTYPAIKPPVTHDEVDALYDDETLFSKVWDELSVRQKLETIGTLILARDIEERALLKETSPMGIYNSMEYPWLSTWMHRDRRSHEHYMDCFEIEAMVNQRAEPYRTDAGWRGPIGKRQGIRPRYFFYRWRTQQLTEQEMVAVRDRGAVLTSDPKESVWATPLPPTTIDQKDFSNVFIDKDFILGHSAITARNVAHRLSYTETGVRTGQGVWVFACSNKRVKARIVLNGDVSGKVRFCEHCLALNQMPVHGVAPWPNTTPPEVLFADMRLGAGTSVAPSETVPSILQFFEYKHLPVSLQGSSMWFHALAKTIVNSLPDNPEREMALRKLLEAKDCAVRASLYKEPS